MQAGLPLGADGEPGQQPLSVSEAVGRANGVVQGLGQLLVVGEISGFRGPNARSGHVYCTLKDDAASMTLTVWRSVYAAAGFAFRDGMQVLALGHFDVYPPSGRLSFVASKVYLAGEGLLRQQVAELARRLEREGLMEESRKRAIPRFCERVCVCTSLSGSVIEDVRRTLARRNPLVAMDCVDCAVQGTTAPASIVRALAVAASWHPEAILLVRGGGSFEDLMCFNDEGVARAIAASPVPVITGIGHEPDVTIADMVADRRCSTPTAAAESVAPAFDEIEKLTESRAERLAGATEGLLALRRTELAQVGRRATLAVGRELQGARRGVEALAAHGCLQSPRAIVEVPRTNLERTAERLADALPRALDARGRDVRLLVGRLAQAGERRLADEDARLRAQGQMLGALSPLKVLGRGYAIVRGPDGHVLGEESPLVPGDEVRVRLATRSFGARVTQVDGRAPEGAGAADGPGGAGDFAKE